MNEPNESINEPDKIINHLEELVTIGNRRKFYIERMQVIGIRRQFIVDAGAPVTIVPPDERITENSEIQKIKNRYENVNKNGVKVRRKN